MIKDTNKNLVSLSALTSRWPSRVCFSLMLLTLLFFNSVAPVGANDAVPLRADGTVLRAYAIKFWQQVNEARRNPLTAAERLGIAEETVRIVFSDRPWILEQGLPPLAWNEQLRFTSTEHGRDMFDRLYYSYVTPEGITVDQRIAATGYETGFTGETINALFFERYIPIDRAFDQLFNTMLRDELTGNMAAQVNIFGSELEQIGVTFFAESIDLVDEQPFVYLIVADFAAPQLPQPFVVGRLHEDSRLAYRSLDGSAWRYAELPAPGLFQLSIPEKGLQLVTVSDNGLGPIGPLTTVTQHEEFRNDYVDLR